MSASAEALIAAEAAGAPGTEVPDDSFGPAVVLNAMSTGTSESGSDAHNDADGAAEGAADKENARVRSIEWVEQLERVIVRPIQAAEVEAEVSVVQTEQEARRIPFHRRT